MSALPFIFIVDDDHNDRVLLHRAFHRAGPPVEVGLCSEGDEALAKLLALEEQARLPDLVVCDLNMAKMGGLALLEALADRPALAAIPTVVLTSGVSPAQRVAVRQTHARACISRPRVLQELQDLAGGLVDILLRIRPKPL